jgi:hypothetical protein
MALTGHIKSDENSAAVSNVCLILGYFSHEWTMALTGHTERMKMRGRANPRSTLGYFHMSERWP